MVRIDDPLNAAEDRVFCRNVKRCREAITTSQSKGAEHPMDGHLHRCSPGRYQGSEMRRGRIEAGTDPENTYRADLAVGCQDCGSPAGVAGMEESAERSRPTVTVGWLWTFW